ncbi:dual oxidase 2 isoform X1 [Ciona intestinalis]
MLYYSIAQLIHQLYIGVALHVIKHLYRTGFNDILNRNRRMDGWYNNLDHPQWGSPGERMIRRSTNGYSNGINKPMKDGLPNPHTLSRLLMRGESGIPSATGKSVFLAFFGQHVGDDMIDSRRNACPSEYINIEIEENKGSNNHILPMYRSKFITGSGSSINSPRMLVNEATSWLDGSVIYGNSHSWSEHLRSFEGGRLKEENGHPGYPSFNRNEIPLYNPTIDLKRPPKTRNPEELLSFGNPRGNENPFLMTIEIIWFRWHNHLAEKIAVQNPDWSDQQIFDKARKWTIATYQNIAFYEWLPEIIGTSPPPYREYNKFMLPSVSVEFSIAAMRLGHSLVPSGVVLRQPNCNPIDPLPEDYLASAGEPALRLCNTYWQLQDALLDQGIEGIVLGMTSQNAEEEDAVVVDDLAGFLYGPLKRTRMDLEAMTIQRGRDAGLQRYNEVRKTYDLPPIKDFSQLNPSLPNEVIARLRNAYNNDTNKLELYVAGMLEDRRNASNVLLYKIILEQFQRTRDGDRLWFENAQNGLFNASELQEIRQTTMRDIIVATTTFNRSLFQPNVFNTAGSRCASITVTKDMFSKSCTTNTGMDFFYGYWGKYAGIVVLMFLFPFVSYFVMCMIAWKRQYDLAKAKKISTQKVARRKSSSQNEAEIESEDGTVFSAFEVEGQDKSRRVVVMLEGTCIKLFSSAGRELRKICFSHFKKSFLFMSRNKRKDLIVIRVPKEYDVVLRFNDSLERVEAIKNVQEFMQLNDVNVDVFEMDESALKEEAVTKEARQALLETFLRQTFAEALNIDDAVEQNSKAKYRHKTMEVADCELTQMELAETMGMKPDSLFVTQMFQLADTDHSGYLSFREFADLIILLMNGSPEQKAKMLFDMYDVDHSGEINREEGRNMIKSFLEMAGANLGPDEVSAAVSTIFKEAGIGENKDSLTLEDFTYVLLKDHREAFESSELSMPGITKSLKKKMNHQVHHASPMIRRQDTYGTSSEEVNGTEIRKRVTSNSDTKEGKSNGKVFSDATVSHEEKTWFARTWKYLKRNVENYRRHIFCMVIFYGITIALVVERATFYAFGAEHIGIRRVTEWGIIISRASAAAMSFHFSFILLTMSRNLITTCRETFLKNFIPFDSAVAFHKQIAYVALVETIFHVLGHASNFYHFCVHPLPVLACLFPKIFVDDGSDLPKSLSWWFFETITGLTGLLLLLTISIIYVFAMQYSRRFCFRAFWITHHLYTVLYILTILHGSLGIVQAPVFHFYLVVPVVIFLIDKMITISRSKVQITVIKAEALPSGVLNLVFKRPVAFDYQSGQWVRIASLSLGTNEYHPFTLTSAPHESYLSLHIRSVGPWTSNLRNLYQTAVEHQGKLPNLYLDGPFGEGHQDWYKYEVSVLVGAGIGVTPFASILKDIVNRTSTKKGSHIPCKKIYFIWVTRTQRHFEWLTDIIRELEETAGGDLVSTHIYITQFANKYDLRTTMLYICERYFQKVANKSMFTGLKAITHFGRPQFEAFLDSLQTKHKEVRTLGVFSCGPPGLTNGVEDACRNLNKLNKARFNHFYENF